MTPELIAFLAGTGTAWTSVLIGMWRQAKKKPKPRKAIPPPEALCGCGDHFALHDRETGECLAVHTERFKIEDGKPHVMQTGYDGREHKVHYSSAKYQVITTKCGCKHYVGPEPMPTYYAPELGQ